MTTLTIMDIPKSCFTKTSYKSEELLKILLKNVNYDVKLDFFSDVENKELLKASNGKYEKISKLID